MGLCVIVKVRAQGNCVYVKCSQNRKKLCVSVCVCFKRCSFSLITTPGGCTGMILSSHCSLISYSFLAAVFRVSTIQIKIQTRALKATSLKSITPQLISKQTLNLWFSNEQHMQMNHKVSVLKFIFVSVSNSTFFSFQAGVPESDLPSHIPLSDPPSALLWTLHLSCHFTVIKVTLPDSLQTH